MKSTFSNRLRDEMGALPPAILASRVIQLGGNCSEAQVYKWLRGQTTPRMETLALIAKALDTSPNNLIGFDS